MNPLKDSILQVLNGNLVVGSSFLVSEYLIATCSHVVETAGAVVGGEVALRLADGRQIWALVDPEFWRDPEAEDICMLRLKEPLDNVQPVILGSTSGTKGHKFSTFGFPSQDQELAGDGVIIETATVSGVKVLQLRSDQVTTGFSGAPIFDEVKERVVGMVASLSQVDLHQRLGTTAFAILAETIREVCPSLKIVDTCPYLGHAAFTEGDAPFYFGREHITYGLLESLKREPRFLVVRGPSGCGKSSAIQAGLFPAVRNGKIPGSETWDIMTIRPGSNPYEQLTLAGLPDPEQGLQKAVEGWLETQPGKTRLLLFLDQCEELLISCPQAVFKKLIQDLAQLLDESIFLTVVLALRDDFYGQFSKIAEPLTERMNRTQMQIPLEVERREQYAIIEEPAHKAGVTFADGLVDKILDDVKGGNRHGDSILSFQLPLLEYTLKQLWERRDEDAFITWDAYHAIGKLGGDLPQQADAVFRCFSDDQKELARFIFRRVIKGGTNLQSRLAQRQEIYPCVGNLGEVDNLIVSLSEGNHRLLIAHDTTVELIHPRLLDWTFFTDILEKDPDHQTLRQNLMDDALDWDKDRSLGRLYSLTQISSIEKLNKKSDFSALECEFITASRRKGYRQRFTRLALITFSMLAVLVLAAIIVPAVFISRQAQTFYAAKDGTEKVESLAKIIQFPRLLAVSPSQTVREIFSGLSAEEQQKLFKNYQGNANDLETVISTIYVSLGESPPNDQTTNILISMQQELLAIPESVRSTYVLEELDAWITARDFIVVEDYAGAVERYTEAIKYNPNNPATYFERGLLFIRIHQYDQALLDLNSAMKLANSLLPTSVKVEEGSEIPSDNQRLISVETAADAISNVIRKNLKLEGTLTNSDANVYAQLRILLLDAQQPENGKVPRIQVELSWENSNDLDLWVLGDDHPRIDYQNPSSEDGWKLFNDANPDCHRMENSNSSSERITWSGDKLPSNVLVGVKLFRVCEGHQSTPFKIIVTIDGKTSIREGEISTEERDQTVDVLNHALDTKLILAIPAKEDKSAVRDIAFSKDGNTLLIATNSIRFISWKIDTEETFIMSFGRPDRFNVALSNDGILAATGDRDGLISAWTINDTPQLLYEIQDHADASKQLLFSPDGRLLAYVSAGSNILIRDSYSGLLLETLLNPNQEITSLAFSPDGDILAAGTTDGTILLLTIKPEAWKFEKGFIPGSSSAPITSMAFASDGNTLAAGDKNGVIHIWDALSMIKLAELDEHTGAITTVRYSPNGKLLVSAALDTVIKIWDVETHEILFTLPDKQGFPALRISFSPDGNIMAVGMQNGHVTIWDIAQLYMPSFER